RNKIDSHVERLCRSSVSVYSRHAELILKPSLTHVGVLPDHSVDHCGRSWSTRGLHTCRDTPTWGGLTAHRRLARDYERHPAASEAMIRWAAINTITHRLTRGKPATRQQKYAFTRDLIFSNTFSATSGPSSLLWARPAWCSRRPERWCPA
ncbi:hypothetical protein ABZ881_15510, partial [Pseudonocardia sp. NPDC046786]